MSRVVAALIAVLGAATIVGVLAASSDEPSASPEAGATPPPSAPPEPPVLTPPPSAPPEPSVATPAPSAPAEPPLATSPADTSANPPQSIPVPDDLGPRMDLVDLHGWLNTDASSLDDFDGKVLLVEMWTFGCSNCKARIPHTQQYAAEFAGENFAIIGVHAPEFSYEAELDNIVEAIDRLGVTWPVALDTDKVNFRAWQPGRTNYWPRTYVIDQRGNVRYDHIGEGDYQGVRDTIRYLLDHPSP